MLMILNSSFRRKASSVIPIDMKGPDMMTQPDVTRQAVYIPTSDVNGGTCALCSTMIERLQVAASQVVASQVVASHLAHCLII
jgi:hypothetical protein